MLRRFWCSLVGHPAGNEPTAFFGRVTFRCVRCRSNIVMDEGAWRRARRHE